ncbi:MAG: hypothetical protein K2Q23_09520 [Bryobacteraceae bacterium]|nr:hypothetical protein [Bryobacteraceae bacterium]
MSSYLATYGAGEQKKADLIKWSILSVVGVAVLSVVLYYSFRHYKERARVSAFFEHIEARNFEAAYELWGCTKQKPCRDYSYEKFLGDWGPQGEYKDAHRASISERFSCVGGIIRTLDFGQDRTVSLWVESKDLLITFAPPAKLWRGCTYLP